MIPRLLWTSGLLYGNSFGWGVVFVFVLVICLVFYTED